MYTGLLKLCGFEDAEIERERPRIDKAFKKLDIGPEDCQRAEDRVRKCFSVELVGVRKLLGIWLKELIDMTLAREEGKRLVYTGVPPPGGLSASLNLAGAWCAVLEYVLGLTIGQIFGKLTPLLEVAEEHGMPPGIACCSMHQLRVGALVRGVAPMPDAAISPGFFCDQSAKVWDLIHELYGVPIMHLDSCMDSNWDEFPKIPQRRVRLYAEDIREAAEELERMLGIELTEETLNAGWRKYTDMRLRAQRIIELSKAEPKPISEVDLTFFWRIVSGPGRRALVEGPEVIDVLTKEVEQRVADGKGVVEKGAPRVAILATPIGDPSVARMFEESGLALIGPLLYFMTPLQRQESQFTTPEEQNIEAILRRGVYHSTSGCIATFKESLKALDVDGFLWFTQFACRAGDPQGLIIKKSIEDDLGIPVLALEADYMDMRSYSSEALRTRVETFADMLRERKAAKVA
jgi:benzoyl-CoA reductase/2-hydroxyglutaryl-CoA dehydratase subunit BcrC/BadD/HgdB